jgi:hypothetical protein
VRWNLQCIQCLGYAPFKCYLKMTPGITGACSSLTPAALSCPDRFGYLLPGLLFKACADGNKLIEHPIAFVFDPRIRAKAGTPDLVCGFSDRAHQRVG